MNESRRARRYGEATATSSAMPAERGHHLHHGPEPNARDEEQGERDEAEDHRRAHVGLGQDEHAGEAGDDEQRADDAAVGGILVEAASDEVGGEQGQRQLHQLRGLQAELAEAHPAARPHGVDPEARDEHDEEEAERHQQDERAEPAQLAVVETDREPKGQGADRHPHCLTDEDGPRCAVGGDRDDGGGRAHHHEADEAEQDDVEQEQRRDREAATADADADAGVRLADGPAVHGGARRAGAVLLRRAGRGAVRTGPAPPFRGGHAACHRHRAHSPMARARRSARSDTRCMVSVSPTAPPKWRTPAPPRVSSGRCSQGRVT